MTRPTPDQVLNELHFYFTLDLNLRNELSSFLTKVLAKDVYLSKKATQEFFRIERKGYVDDAVTAALEDAARLGTLPQDAGEREELVKNARSRGFDMWKAVRPWFSASYTIAVLQSHRKGQVVLTNAETESLLWHSVDTLIANYPDFQGLDREELNLLLNYRNAVAALLTIFPSKNNKGHLMEVASRLEGVHGREYPTGSGQMEETTRREIIFEKEGNYTPVKVMSRITKKRKLAAAVPVESNIANGTVSSAAMAAGGIKTTDLSAAAGSATSPFSSSLSFCASSPTATSTTTTTTTTTQTTPGASSSGTESDASTTTTNETSSICDSDSDGDNEGDCNGGEVVIIYTGGKRPKCKNLYGLQSTGDDISGFETPCIQSEHSGINKNANDVNMQPNDIKGNNAKTREGDEEEEEDELLLAFMDKFLEQSW